MTFIKVVSSAGSGGRGQNGALDPGAISVGRKIYIEFCILCLIKSHQFHILPRVKKNIRFGIGFYRFGIIICTNTIILLCIIYLQDCIYSQRCAVGHKTRGLGKYFGYVFTLKFIYKFTILIPKFKYLEKNKILLLLFSTDHILTFKFFSFF